MRLTPVLVTFFCQKIGEAEVEKEKDVDYLSSIEVIYLIYKEDDKKYRPTPVCHLLVFALSSLLLSLFYFRESNLSRSFCT